MKHSIVVFSLMAMSGMAFADGFNYTYVEANYGTVDVDTLVVDGDGLGVNGSYGITDDLNIVGRARAADFDAIGDSTDWSVGLGVHTSITELMDVTASVSYLDREFEPLIGPALEDDGFELAVGIRANVLGMIEVNAAVTYVDLSTAGDDTGFSGSALYNFNDTFSVGLSAKWEETLGADTATYALSGRMYFGN